MGSIVNDRTMEKVDCEKVMTGRTIAGAIIKVLSLECVCVTWSVKF